MKILVVIANYGTKQLYYLKQVVEEFQNNYKVEVDIIVNTDVEVHIQGIKNNVLKLEDNLLYPLSSWKTIYENRKDYDVFMFTENDHKITYETFELWYKLQKSRPIDEIIGLIQCEYDNEGNIFYPAFHDPWCWTPNSSFRDGDVVYAEFENKHQGCFMFLKEQFDYVFNKVFSGYLETMFNQDYGKQEQANTNLFYLFKRKLIPISHLDKMLVHHLPNKYLEMGGDYWSMKTEVDYLIYKAKQQ